MTSYRPQQTAFGPRTQIFGGRTEPGAGAGYDDLHGLKPTSLLSEFDQAMDDDPPMRRNATLSDSPIMGETIMNLSPIHSPSKTNKENYPFSSAQVFEDEGARRQETDINKRLQKAKAQLAHYEKECKNVQYQHKKAVQNLKLSAELGEVYTKENDELKAALALEERKFKKVQQDNAEIKRHAQKLAAENNSLKGAQAKVQAKGEDLYAKHQKLQQQHKVVVNLRASLENEVSQLKLQVATEQNVSKSLRGHNATISAKNQEYQQRLKGMEMQSQQLQQQSGKMSNDMTQFRNHAAHSQKQLNDQISQLGEKIVKLKNENRLLQDQIRGKDAKIQQMREERAKRRNVVFSKSASSPKHHHRGGAGGGGGGGGGGLCLTDQIGTGRLQMANQCDHSDICNAVEILKRSVNGNMKKVLDAVDHSPNIGGGNGGYGGGCGGCDNKGLEKFIQTTLTDQLKILNQNIQGSFEVMVKPEDVTLLKQSVSSVKETLEAVQKRLNPSTETDDTKSIIDDFRKMIPSRTNRFQDRGYITDIGMWAVYIIGAVIFVLFLSSFTPQYRFSYRAPN